MDKLDSREPDRPKATPAPGPSPDSAKKAEEYEDDLELIRDRVRGVASGYYTGLYLYGRPGTSKTFTVKKTLEQEGRAFHYHAGHVTPMGLFELISEHPDGILVLDDVSEIVRQPVAVQLLLAALGHQSDAPDIRVVRYKRLNGSQSVDFTGGVICVSNLPLPAASPLQALRSRVHYIEHDPSDEHLAALMFRIASKGWPEESPKVTPANCGQVAAFLIEACKRRGVPLDIRLLVNKAFPDFYQHQCGDAECDWRELIITTLDAHLRSLAYSRPAASRQERKQEEFRIVKRLLTEHPAREDQIAEWERLTDKSSRAFYRAP